MNDKTMSTMKFIFVLHETKMINLRGSVGLDYWSLQYRRK